jgi:hypothetical protein
VGRLHDCLVTMIVAGMPSLLAASGDRAVWARARLVLRSPPLTPHLDEGLIVGYSLDRHRKVS